MEDVKDLAKIGFYSNELKVKKDLFGKVTGNPDPDLLLKNDCAPIKALCKLLPVCLPRFAGDKESRILAQNFVEFLLRKNGSATINALVKSLHEISSGGSPKIALNGLKWIEILTRGISDQDLKINGEKILAAQGNFFATIKTSGKKKIEKCALKIISRDENHAKLVEHYLKVRNLAKLLP